MSSTLGLGNNMTMGLSSLSQSSSSNDTMKQMSAENDRMMQQQLEITKFNNQNTINKSKMDAMAQQTNGMLDTMSQSSSKAAEKAKISLS